MNSRFLTSVFLVGFLALVSLPQAADAKAGGNGGGGNGGGGNGGGGNGGGGGSRTVSTPTLPVVSGQLCSVGDLSLGGGSANSCFGQVTNPNNDVGSAPNLFTFLNQSGDNLDFGYIGQWLSAGSEIQNGNGSNGLFTSSTSSGSAAQSGNWGLTLTPNQVIQALVISVKGGAGWSAYLFDPSNLASSFSGTWTTLGLRNNGGQQPNISHISAYYVLGQTPPPTPIPTPALLPGLIGMGLAAMRKKKQAEVKPEM